MRNTRRDAVRIKNLDGFHSIVPYVMPKRTEAEVSITEHFDVTDLNGFMKAHNEANGTGFKLFHAICTAIAKTIYQRPKMNTFIAGRAFWQRKDITLSFVVKRKFEDNSEESLMFMKVLPEMNLELVSRMILGDVQKVRTENNNDLGKTMEFVGKLPRFILEILFFFIKRMEYHGIVPEAITKGDPNYSTALLANLGSIGAGAPYHHLSDYGTCSIMITIGTMHKENDRDIVDCTFTLDERIADGFYYAKSLKLTKFLLEHPDSLMQRMDAPVAIEL